MIALTFTALGLTLFTLFTLLIAADLSGGSRRTPKVRHGRTAPHRHKIKH